jgi:3-hydroxyisobutyrate dehydrogenase-like beta-hydroxyacid dehydrogenase
VEVVLSVNAAAVALDVARALDGALGDGQLYADLNTGLPALKVELDRIVSGTGASFVDVALLGTAGRLGLATPALASGEGAERFAELFRPLGMPIELAGPVPGDAAGRKLLRSVFMKGLAASVVESLEAASEAGAEPWLRDQILRVLRSPSEQLLERLVSGTSLHATRRREEMEAAAEHLHRLGVEPHIALAAAARLADISRATTEHDAAEQADLI